MYKLAQLSSLSTTYIHELEKGKKQPTIETAEKLYNALQITLSDFLDRSPKEHISFDELIKQVQDLSPEQLDAISNLIKVMKMPS